MNQHPAVNRETEIVAESEQSFLARQQHILFAGGNNTQGPRLGESPIRTPPIGKGTVRPSATHGSPKKLDGAKVVSSPGGEGVLANFFNSLLHKKTGSSPSTSLVNKTGTPESITEKAAMRSDAAAELDRLARGGKKPTPNTSGVGGIDFNASDC